MTTQGSSSEIGGGRAIQVRPNPFSARRLEAWVPEGGSVAAMCGLTPEAATRAGAAGWRVMVDGHSVPFEIWHRVYPKAGTEIECVMVPQGGGGKKSPLAFILALTVVVAAFAFGPQLGALFPAVTGALGVSAAQFGGMLISLVGSLLISALVPPPSMGGGGARGLGPDSSVVPLVTGTQNRANQFGAVPVVLGRRRIYPTVIGQSTRNVGGQQIFEALYLVGYGRVRLSDVRIGETPIGEFKQARWETREGYDGEAARRIFTRDVAGENFNIALKEDVSHVRRALQPASRFQLDFSMPGGLAEFADNGDHEPYPIDLQIEYRLEGSIWQDASQAPDLDQSQEGISFAGARRVMRRVRQTGLVFVVDGGRTVKLAGIDIELDANGVYDFRVTRKTPDGADAQTLDDIRWTTLSARSAANSVNMENVATVAISVRADDQLSGSIQTLNCIAESYLPVFDGAAWSEEVSRNCAWAYAYALTGRPNKRGLGLSRLAALELKAWADFCTDNAFTYDQILDAKATVFERLQEIAAAGLAMRTINDGLHGVVVDKERTARVQLFTPRNSRDFRATKIFHIQPDALRIRYWNEESEQQDERIVYDDGFDETNAEVFEILDAPGVSTQGHAWRLGRYHLAVGRLRPETFTFAVDFEFLRCTRGSLVGVQYDTILVGISAARIKAVTVDGGGAATAVELDELVPQEPVKTYGLRMRLDDATQILQPVINSSAGATIQVATLTFDPPIPDGQPQPEAGDLVAYGETGKVDMDCIVKTIEPADNLEARLTVVPENVGVHTAHQGPIPPYDPLITLPPDLSAALPAVPIIEEVSSDESALLRAGSGFVVRAIMTLRPRETVLPVPEEIQAQTQPAGTDNWVFVPGLPGDAPQVIFDDIEEGRRYDFRVRARRGNLASDWAVLADYLVIGRTTPPPDVDGLLLTGSELSWPYPVRPIDFAGFEVRHQSGNSRGWESATLAHDGVVTETLFDISTLPRGLRTYLVKAVDVAGTVSINAATLVRDLGGEPVANVVEVEDYGAAGYPGDIEGGQVNGGVIEADDTGMAYWTGDADANWTGDAEPAWTDTWFALTYTAGFTPPGDLLDAKLTLDVAAVAEGWSLLYRPDSEEAAWTDDGAPYWTFDWEPAWTPRPPFSPWPGRLEGPGLTEQHYQFRAELLAGAIRGTISAFKVVLDLPDITESFEDLAVPVGGLRLPITKSYRRIVVIPGLTLHDDGGDAAALRIEDKDPVQGPLIQAFNKNGQPTTALMDAAIQGY